MKKSKMFVIVKKLPFDKKEIVYTKDGTIIYLLRPSKLPKRFKKYDREKNFQIWLKEGTREFRPNHLRLLIDLNLRIRSRNDLRDDLLLAFDGIYYGNDPVQELVKLTKEKFEHYLNDIVVMGYLAQLFVIEQEYCYIKESKFDPLTLFFQGWVRQFIDSPRELDNMCMSVANRQPPMVMYTSKENKKHKKYQAKLQPLWYIPDYEQLPLK